MKFSTRSKQGGELLRGMERGTPGVVAQNELHSTVKDNSEYTAAMREAKSEAIAEMERVAIVTLTSSDAVIEMGTIVPKTQALSPVQNEAQARKLAKIPDPEAGLYGCVH